MSNQIAIILGSFHKTSVEEMLSEARITAKECDLKIIAEQWVPGSMEKPLALKRFLIRNDVDAAIALGIIEKGETKHGLVMGHAVINAIVQLQLEFMKPIGLGILGPDVQPSQIPPRLKPHARNAVMAVKSML
ncbi:6,7-dimethyl-8-ribityllumazine synthase [Candidatus Parabeggiatoa sp. HSG14]|uniref:6,7-dimethyl-8-ribityllumazine synthase n=1 Tax=Candidatus Parabeggiatoa sp. HSG14 TaxID=3055593 RepID=UPI0025A90A9D|nr:6,7-dimethyl-8-ribityllumazine synthase [Thiotrichales bacterium HSG14]